LFEDDTTGDMPAEKNLDTDLKGPQRETPTHLVKFMQHDERGIANVSKAVKMYLDRVQGDMKQELHMRRRENELLSRRCALLEANLKELHAAYLSEDQADVIRDLRRVVSEQTEAIRYYLTLTKFSSIDGRNARGATVVRQGSTAGVLESLERTLNDLAALAQTSKMIDQDRFAATNLLPGDETKVKQSRQAALTLESNAVRQAAEEFFRRAHDVFQRIDGTARGLFQDTTYAGLLTWSQDAKTSKEAIHAMEKSSNPHIPSPRTRRSSHAAPGSTLLSPSFEVNPMRLDRDADSHGNSTTVPQGPPLLSRSSSAQILFMPGQSKPQKSTEPGLLSSVHFSPYNTSRLFMEHGPVSPKLQRVSATPNKQIRGILPIRRSPGVLKSLKSALHEQQARSQSSAR